MQQELEAKLKEKENARGAQRPAAPDRRPAAKPAAKPSPKPGPAAVTGDDDAKDDDWVPPRSRPAPPSAMSAPPAAETPARHALPPVAAQPTDAAALWPKAEPAKSPKAPPAAALAAGCKRAAGLGAGLGPGKPSAAADAGGRLRVAVAVNATAAALSLAAAALDRQEDFEAWQAPYRDAAARVRGALAAGASESQLRCARALAMQPPAARHPAPLHPPAVLALLWHGRPRECMHTVGAQGGGAGRAGGAAVGGGAAARGRRGRGPGGRGARVLPQPRAAPAALHGRPAPVRGSRSRIRARVSLATRRAVHFCTTYRVNVYAIQCLVTV